MKKIFATVLVGGAVLLPTTSSFGHGFGGANEHAPGGEAGRGAGGFNRSQGAPNTRGAGTGGNRSTERPNAQRPGETTTSRGGYPASSSESYSEVHASQPTDAGFGTRSAATGQPTATRPQSNASMAQQGAAVRNSYNGAGTFNQNWYGSHPDAWHASGWAAGDEWHTGGWAAVAPAAGISATAQPVPYNYGYASAPVPGDQSTADNQPASAPDPNYQQSTALSQSAPPSSATSSTWTPLGVFALVRDAGATPHYVMQLAVNKSGALAGNYVDLVTDSVKPVQGAVDPKTQRVAWTVGDNQTTVGEAGLANLAQDEAPAIIHIGPDKPQQWLLVRLKQSPKS